MKKSVRLSFRLKIFLFFFIFILYSLLSILYSPSSFAQATNLPSQQSNNPAIQQSSSYAAPNTEEDVPPNLHTYSQNVVIEVMAAVSCQLAGVDPTTPDGRCLGPDPKTGKIGYVDNDGGAIGFMSNMITVLYTPPAHTADYVRNLAQNFGITKNAYARLDDYEDAPGSPTTDSPVEFGTGFYSISPLINIWTAFRNIAYMLFVLVFVVIGVAIMLRIKIDPRTVMTIQNQIPKIIIGILLVTFSFAIAGFLIDVMWIAIYLFYGVFHSIPGVDITSLSPQNIAGTTPMGVVGLSGGWDIAFSGAKAVSGVIASMLNNPIGNILGKVIGALIGGAIGQATSPLFQLGGAAIGAGIGTFIAPGLGTAAGAGLGAKLGAIIAPTAGAVVGLSAGGSNTFGLIGGIVAFLIIAIALLWALFRVWFALLGAYIAILINIVFAPFWIIGSLIPGSKISFSGWLRSMLGNLAAFPATLVMFMLGKTFMDTITYSSVASGQAFVPPFIGNLAETKTFGALIGLGIILTIPNVVKMMRSTFGAPALELGGVGAAIGAGATVPGRLVGGTVDATFSPHVDEEGQWHYPGGVWGKAIRAFRGRH